MEQPYHIPALLNETIAGLQVKADGVYVDATFGGGGHSGAILNLLGQHGTLFSFDRDREALENAKSNVQCTNWQLIHSDFRYVSQWMDFYGIAQIDGLLADLGVSFHHFDTAERGFSFRFNAPLGMRMNRKGGTTAADIVNTYSEEELSRILYQYGELKQSRQMARRIVKTRANEPIMTTDDLVCALTGIRAFSSLSSASDSREHRAYKHDLTLAFQALRMEVNDELGALRELLEAALTLLKSGGRIAVLTYHSLEDRLVKNFLRSGNLEGRIEKDFYGNILTPFRLIEKGLTAGEEEVARNPRARSAKLRIAEKI